MVQSVADCLGCGNAYDCCVNGSHNMATDISEMIRLAMQKDSLLRGKTQGDVTMAMIKCSECGKDISDKAAFCVGCGNPIASVSKSIGDIDGDGKVGLGDVMAAEVARFVRTGFGVS
jgi:hypothetical protein